MKIRFIKKIVELITNYEETYNGYLKQGYNDRNEFIRDLKTTVKEEGLKEVYNYYNFYKTTMNDTNSTKQQRKDLDDLLLVMVGQI